MTLALALLLWMGSQQHTGCYPDGASGRYELACDVTPSSACGPRFPSGDGCNSCQTCGGITSCTLVYCMSAAKPEWITSETKSDPGPEPIDVPAIQEERVTYVTSGHCRAVNGDDPDCKTTSMGAGLMKCALVSCEKEEHKEIVTTCADKSRILLTDESGGKHCIKFPKEDK